MKEDINTLQQEIEYKLTDNGVTDTEGDSGWSPGAWQSWKRGKWTDTPHERKDN